MEDTIVPIQEPGSKEQVLSEEQASDAAPVSASERDAICAELGRLLASSHFHSSLRCSKLLRYTVEQSLNGQVDSLKERLIGMTVFKRDAMYDTSADPIVRSTASELRKKLAQHYYDHANQSEVVIELPIGSYVPAYRFAGASAHDAGTAVDGSAEETDTGAEAGITIPAVAEPRTETASASRRLYASRKWFLWGAVAVLVAAAVLAVAASNLFRSIQSVLWAPILQSGKPVAICVGDLAYLGNTNDPHDPDNVNWKAQKQVLTDIVTERKLPDRAGLQRRTPQVPFSDVRVATQFSSYLAKHGRGFTVLRESDVTLDDLRRGPAVVVGGLDNDWANFLLSGLRYRIRVNPDAPEMWIEDTQNPGRRDWLLTGQHMFSDSYVDYAIVTRLFYPESGNWILLATGLNAHGTEAAGELLTNPEVANSLPAVFRSNMKNFQIVLKITSVNGHAGQTQILATYTW